MNESGVADEVCLCAPTLPQKECSNVWSTCSSENYTLQPRIESAHVGADPLPLGDRCQHQELQGCPSAKAALRKCVLRIIAVAVGVQIRQVADNRHTTPCLANFGGRNSPVQCREYTSAR